MKLKMTETLEVWWISSIIRMSNSCCIFYKKNFGVVNSAATSCWGVREMIVHFAEVTLTLRGKA